MSSEALNFSRARRLPVVQQAEAAECGLACLVMIARYHGHRVDLNGMRQRFALSLKGAPLREIMRMADALQLSPRAVRVELEHLRELQTPAILHWDLNHYVVLKDVRGDRIHVHDPAKGARTYTVQEASRHFTGVALEITPAVDFKPQTAESKTRLSDLWSRLSGLKRALIQILLLSAIIQFVALATPFYLQLVIDEAVVKLDRGLLLVLALSFAGVYLIGAVTELLRGWAILYFGNMMTFQMVGNIFRHLMRLPAGFFEKRHIGDIISRMGSTRPIQEAMTQGFVAAFIDGAMALVTGVVLFLYSPMLAGIVFASVALYLVAVLAIYPAMRRRQEEAITTAAREQSHLMESIRSAKAVKLFGRESERENAWRNLYADSINAKVSYGKYTITAGFLQSLIYGMQLVIVVYVAALVTLEGGFTVGMLFAFMSYRQNFSQRMAGLVGQIIQFRLLSLHLERIGDIVQSPRDPSSDIEPDFPEADSGRLLTLESVKFRYSRSDPLILEDVSLTVEPGEFIAITGPSGGGKTTLFKLLLGLYPPTEGEVRINGEPLSAFGARRWREGAGVVMQDDALFSGTIADNIAFFDPDLDMQRVRAAATAACVHEDIMRQPMNYLGLVGDMGTTLSGGQRQRVLLARALYRHPQILFLDEGTANLDEETERQIADAVSAMSITRIVVAHRPELVSRADRVLEMRNGRLSELRNGRSAASQ